MARAQRRQWRTVWRPLVVTAVLLGTLYGALVVTGTLTPRLGLDLEGGTSVILTAKPAQGEEVDGTAIEQAVEIIRQRVNSLGVAEAQVVQQGEQIVVSVPGKARDEVVNLVGQTAELRFREVLCSGPPVPIPAETDPATLTTCNDQLSPGGVPTVTPDPAVVGQYYAETCADPASKSAVVDDPAAQLVTCAEDGSLRYLLAPAQVVGTDIEGASAGLGANSQGVPTGAWQVNIEFTSDGQEKWTNLTAATVGGRVAIVLDGLVQSAPTIQTAIPGDAQISGGFDEESATNLAEVLQYGALPLAFDQSQAQTVSATLGEDSLKAGLSAGALGLLLIVLYCLAYYRLLGIVTIFALGVAGALVYGMVVLLGDQIGFTLTLAGIAGLIVSIGITADSFVVFYERLKDEVEEGRHGRAAVERGWVRARRTILSANTVSLLAAIILYTFSIGDVRGFAFTLGLSTLIDLVVVFLFTKPVVSLLAERKLFRRPALSGLGRRRVGTERVGAGR